MSYGCVRIDNMSGTVNGKDLVSLKYKVSNADTAIENGNIVAVGDLIAGEREVRLASTPTAATALGDLALVASEEVVKSKSHNTLGEFINEAGDIIRGYRLESKDIFSITSDAFECAEDVTPAVGKFLEAKAGTKMLCVTSITANSTKIGKIIAIEGEWYVIEVA